MEETFWFVSNSHNGWPTSRLFVVGLIQWSVYVWLATWQRGLRMVCSVKHKDCQYRIYPKNYAHKSLCFFCCGMALVVFIHIHIPLHWRHNEHDGVSNHQPHGCLLNRLIRRRSKKTSKLRVTGICVGNSPGPVNSPHKGPVTQKMFPFDDVIILHRHLVNHMTIPAPVKEHWGIWVNGLYKLIKNFNFNHMKIKHKKPVNIFYEAHCIFELWMGCELPLVIFR